MAKKSTGPDFARGVSLTKFTDGAMLQGHFKGEPILVARREDAYFAIGATCTHYSGPLADGISDASLLPTHKSHSCPTLRLVTNSLSTSAASSTSGAPMASPIG